MHLTVSSFVILSSLPVVLSFLGGRTRFMYTHSPTSPRSSSSPSSENGLMVAHMKGMKRGSPHRGGGGGASFGANYNSKRKWNRSRTSHRSTRKENMYSPVGYQLGDVKNLKTMFEANADEEGTLSYDSFIDSRYLRYW